MTTHAKAPFLRTAYNYDMEQASFDSGLYCEDPSLAQQNARDETDINEIMRRFGKGQALPESFSAPQYGDFLQVTDYQTALNAVREATENFNAMPPDLRARFHNDPQELLTFVEDESNRPEAIKLGLVAPPPPPPPPEPAKAPESKS